MKIKNIEGTPIGAEDMPITQKLSHIRAMLKLMEHKATDYLVIEDKIEEGDKAEPIPIILMAIKFLEKDGNKMFKGASEYLKMAGDIENENLPKKTKSQ